MCGAYSTKEIYTLQRFSTNMNEEWARVKVLFTGVQATLLAIFLLVLGKSVSVVFGLSILLAMAGTTLVAFAIKE